MRSGGSTPSHDEAGMRSGPPLWPDRVMGCDSLGRSRREAYAATLNASAATRAAPLERLMPMKLKAIGRAWNAVLCSVILVGAGAVLVTPVANAVAGINWSSVWTHQLQPRADKRYFTKAQATKKFAPNPKVIRGAYFSQITAAD